jgi:hypothetical protein
VILTAQELGNVSPGRKEIVCGRRTTCRFVSVNALDSIRANESASNEFDDSGSQCAKQPEQRPWTLRGIAIALRAQ